MPWWGNTYYDNQGTFLDNIGNAIVDVTGFKQRFKKARISYTMIDAGLEERTYSFVVNDVELDINAARQCVEAIAKLTNCALKSFRFVQEEYLAPDDLVAFDEAYSSHGTQLVLFFQDANDPDDTFYVHIPAPDLGYFEDGIPSRDEGNFIFDAIGHSIPDTIEDIQDQVNVSGHNYKVPRMYVIQNGKKTVQVPFSSIGLEEPGTGDTPGDSPATGGLIP